MIFFGLPVDGGFGIVAVGGGEALQIRAVVFGEENVVAGIDGPDIAFAAVGGGRASGRGEMRGGVEDVLAIGQEVAAGGAALAGRDQCADRSRRRS